MIWKMTKKLKLKAIAFIITECAVLLIFARSVAYNKAMMGGFLNFAPAAVVPFGLLGIFGARYAIKILKKAGHPMVAYALLFVSFVSLPIVNSFSVIFLARFMTPFIDTGILTKLNTSIGAWEGEIRPGATEAVPYLIANLKSESNYDRRGAANWLRIIGPGAKEAIPALMNALADQDSEVRGYSFSALQAIGAEPERVISVLILALRHQDAGVRVSAASVLEKYGPVAVTAVPDLIRTLEDPDVNVRRVSASALGKIGTLEARQALDRYRKIPDEMVAAEKGDTAKLKSYLVAGMDPKRETSLTRRHC